MDLLAVAQQADQIKDLGRTLIASGLLPDAIKKPEAALAVMLQSQELGIGPMYGLSNIAIVSGKPVLSAELMAALVRRAGHRLRVIESTDERCTVEGIRRDDPSYKARETFTIEDAKRAGLTGKGPWKQYPKTMLRWRAISALCKFHFGEVLGGAYAPEELGVDFDEEGTPVINSSQDSSDTGLSPETEIEVLIGHIEQELADWPRDPAQPKPDAEQVYTWARQSLDSAQKALARVRKLQRAAWGKNIQEARAAPPGEASYNPGFPAGEAEEPGDPRRRLDAEVVEDSPGELAGGIPGELPEPRARKSQVDLLQTLAEELRGEHGVSRLEERIGKPLTELTRDEADDWIERLTPEGHQ